MKVKSRCLKAAKLSFVKWTSFKYDSLKNTVCDLQAGTLVPEKWAGNIHELNKISMRVSIKRKSGDQMVFGFDLITESANWARFTIQYLDFNI